MSSHEDLRTFERIPIENRVRVRSGGRMAYYALAINLSMGGLLLGATPPLPVGSPCEVAIFLANGGKKVVEGTVVRSADSGTAIQFAHTLENAAFSKILGSQAVFERTSLAKAYLNYFKVSQKPDYEGSEKLLGVTKATFRKVFLTTFCTSIPLAVLPVWAFHAALPPAPNWLKVILCFVYGFIWLGLIQPFADLAIFRVLRRPKVSSAPKI